MVSDHQTTKRAQVQARSGLGRSGRKEPLESCACNRKAGRWARVHLSAKYYGCLQINGLRVWLIGRWDKCALRQSHVKQKRPVLWQQVYNTFWRRKKQQKKKFGEHSDSGGDNELKLMAKLRRNALKRPRRMFWCAPALHPDPNLCLNS